MSKQRSDRPVRLKVLMPGKVVVDETADMVIVRTEDGDKGILPGHEPCYITLGYGLLRVVKSGERLARLIVAGGFATVRDGEVTVMTPVADTPERIERAIESINRERAENKLFERAADLEMNRAETALRHTLVRRETSAFAVLKGRMGKDDG